jgi:hypothetical protein
MMISNVFKIKKIERTKFQIFVWWELRRIIFNFFNFVFIVLGLKIIDVDVLKLEMGSGEYFLILGIILAIIILNLAYSFGWIIELFKQEKSLTFAPSVFKNLVLFSIAMFSLLFCLIFIILKN